MTLPLTFSSFTLPTPVQGGFDVIVDTVGDSQNAPATKAVKKGGVFIRLATAFIFWKVRG